ncbi:hypothetical protein EV188_104619 [Actinomycetospora succinea]|uniref:Integral membrane protein n=1 Tax=Actinomycetospora succinea TaxID=663603 RepID=A0A4R6VEI7_9PSEU|nr:hypothetical protein [Actinomycetospora succinea]TDQ58870.1 hypothetical protein EV188_104619 [Actinomycetospora succinea]
MTTATAPAPAAPTLRPLYLARFVFALVWAVLLFLGASSVGVLTAALLVLYPVVDAAAAVVDARTSRADAAPLAVNVAISALAAVGLALAVGSGVPAVLRVWGAWAVVAGVVQLVVAVRRRRVGGQGAMVLSGGLSVLAGAAFVAMASGPGPSLAAVAGYALLGGVFFLVLALRLGRGRS